MTQRRKKRIFKAVRYGLILLVMYILQALFFGHFRIFGCVPMLFPALIVGSALYDRPMCAGVVGLCSGVICDVALNQATILFTLLFTAAGLGLAVLAQRVLTRGLLTYALTTLALLLLTAFVQMFSLLFFAGQNVLSLLSVAALQTAISLVFAVPTYPAVRAAARD